MSDPYTFNHAPIHSETTDDELDQMARDATDDPVAANLLKQTWLDYRNQMKAADNVPSTLDSPSGIPNVAGMIGGMIDSYQGSRGASAVETQLKEQSLQRAHAREQVYAAVRGQPDRAAYAAALMNDPTLAAYAKQQGDQQTAQERDLTDSANRAEDVAYRQGRAAAEDRQTAAVDAATAQSRREQLELHYDQLRDRDQQAKDKAAEKTTAAGQKAHDNAALAITGIDQTVDAIDRLSTHPGLGGIYGVQGRFPNMPGGDAAGAKALLDGLVSKEGLQAMAQMRQSGGSFGRTTNIEFQALQNAVAPLADQHQSAAQVRQTLANYRAMLLAAKTKLQGAADADAGGSASYSGASPSGNGNVVQYDATGARVGG